MSKKGVMSVTEVDRIMERIFQRREVVQTQVRSLCQGYTTALFLYGPGGLGKTHLVTTELDAMCGGSWRHHTAYSTPKALMLSIAEYPEMVHLFEDCEKLYKTDVAASILRAACGSPKQRSRIVTYETQTERYSVDFRGAICIVSNENLARCRGPLAAVASRFRPIAWDMTVEERIAAMLSIARDGWFRGDYKLSSKQTKHVAEYLVGLMMTGETDRPADLRLLTEHAFPAYAQWLADKTGSHWHEIIRAKLSGQVQEMEKRGDRNARLEAIAYQIGSDKSLNTKARVLKWKTTTGLGQAIFYRHLQRAKQRK